MHTVVSAVLLLRVGKNAKIKGDAVIAMISVGSLAIGYLLMNLFSTSSNLSGDVCSTLFGSTSILTLTREEVWLCAVLSVVVLAVFGVFYNKLFAVTFDESFAKAVGTKTDRYNLLIAVIIAGWTTANPTFYRVALSLNAVFKKRNHKQMTYIAGCLITLAACFPIVQRASDILTFLGLAVEGVGAICIAEEYIFPKIGYTKYWSMYKKQEINPAAAISWGISIAFVVLMILTRPLHQNFWFLPNYIIPMVSYILLAGRMGAREKYPEEEQEEMDYEEALQNYVNNLVPEVKKVKTPKLAAGMRILSFLDLAAFAGVGIACSLGFIGLELFKTAAFVLSLIYFTCNGASMLTMYGLKSEIDERGAKELLKEEYNIDAVPADGKKTVGGD